MILKTNQWQNKEWLLPDSIFLMSAILSFLLGVKKRLLKIQKFTTQTIEQFLFGNWIFPFVVTFHIFTSSPIPHFWKANIVIVTQCHPPLTTLDRLCMINFSKEQLQLVSTESTKGSNRVQGIIMKLSFCHGYRAKCHLKPLFHSVSILWGNMRNQSEI